MADNGTSSNAGIDDGKDDLNMSQVVHDSNYYIGASFGFSCAVVLGFYTVIVSGPINDIPSCVLVFYCSIGKIQTKTCT